MSNKDDSIHSLKAINLKFVNGVFQKLWELNDAIDHRLYEKKISFWTKYFEFKDYDNDSLIEPIVVYGTLGLNDYDDGRVKFLVYFRGKKIGIRYQGCVEDCRSLSIDKPFYDLPQKLQEDVKAKMLQIQENQGIIYPRHWEEGFRKRLTLIRD